MHFQKLIQKDFFHVHSHINKILSSNGLCSSAKELLQKTPSSTNCNLESKKLVKETNKMSAKLNITKFQPDFASTPNYKLPKTSTPIIEDKKLKKKVTNCKRLVFSKNNKCHHHRHHHYHRHRCHFHSQETQFKHYFLDLTEKSGNFDLRNLNSKNSCLIINKAKYSQKIVNTNYTNSKTKTIQHNHQHLDLLAQFQFYQ